MYHKIFIVGLSNIGDAFLTLPTLVAVRNAIPEAEITLLCGMRAAEVFQGDPRWNRVIVYQRKWPWRLKRQLLRQLWREQFDLVIDLRNGMWRWLLQPLKIHPFIRSHPNQHLVAAHLEWLRPLGLTWDGSGSLVWIGPEAEQQVQAWVAQADGPLRVAVAPGARSHIKRWTAAGFAGVINHLLTMYHATVFLIGEREEQPTVDEVLCQVNHPVVNLCGQTTVRQLVALLRHCQLVITNDSASLHMACAVGTPVVAIFGPTNEEKAGPWSYETLNRPDIPGVSPQDHHLVGRVVRKQLHCTPCEQSLCRYRLECMRWLTVDEVWQHVQDLIERRNVS